MIGPKHYEGWSCEGCDYLHIGFHLYCHEPSILDMDGLDNEIFIIHNTPLWCPYLKHAIDQHHWDEL